LNSDFYHSAVQASSEGDVNLDWGFSPQPWPFPAAWGGVRLALKATSFDAIIDVYEGENFMRSTFALDDDLLSKARALTGLEENGPLMREALQALIQRESARRLAKLGGIDKTARVTPRRRPIDK
jgi:hypothetical protein